MQDQERLKTLWREEKVTIDKWTSNCDTTMFIDVTVKDEKIMDIFNFNDYIVTNMGNNRFIIKHKDITQSHLVYALVEHIHVDDSTKYKGCVNFLSKTTTIEYDMKKIKEKFPLASIVAVEHVKGCWSDYEDYVVRLGEPKL